MLPVLTCFPTEVGAPAGRRLRDPQFQPGPRPVGRKGRLAAAGDRGSGEREAPRPPCPLLTGVSLSFLPGDRCRPCGPKPREAVVPQRRRPAPGRPREPLPARGRRHHAPGRRQLPRQAPRRRRPGAPARGAGARQSRGALSAPHLGRTPHSRRTSGASAGRAGRPRALGERCRRHSPVSSACARAALSPTPARIPAQPRRLPAEPLRRTACLRGRAAGEAPEHDVALPAKAPASLRNLPLDSATHSFPPS